MIHHSIFNIIFIVVFQWKFSNEIVITVNMMITIIYFFFFFNSLYLIELLQLQWPKYCALTDTTIRVCLFKKIMSPLLTLLAFR